MELKINCNAFVKLKNLLGVTNIESKISDYQYHGDTLEGKLLISGTYFDSDNLNENQLPFREEVPFMVIFKDDQNVIDHVTSDNFNYYEVAGRGIETSFDVLVNYREKSLERSEMVEIDAEDVTTEYVTPVDEVPEVSSDNRESPEELTSLEREEPNEEDLTDEDRALEDLLNEAKQAIEDVAEITPNQTLNEAIKERVSKTMDIILSEKMGTKTDNFPAEEVNRSIASSKATVKVLYYQDDRMLDTLCAKYDLSIEEVLKQKKAHDGKRMIIGID